MPEPINFLGQLVQSGALNTFNPMEAYGNALKLKGTQTAIKGAELDNETKALTLGSEYLKRVGGLNEYPQFREYAIKKLGIPSTVFPEEFGSESEFEDWRLTATTTAAERIKLKQGQEVTLNWDNGDGTRSEYKVHPSNIEGLIKEGLIPKNARLGTVEGTPWKPLARMAQEEDIKESIKAQYGENWGEPYIDKQGNAVQKNLKTGKINKISSPPKGMKLTVGPDGEIELVEGTEALTPKVTSDIQTKLLAAKEQKTRMEGILATYKPEYLEYGTRFGFAWNELSEKMGNTLPKEDKKSLQEFHTFKRRAQENINLYIKEITGAQMSEAEANRLKTAVPDPGETWWKGDSPTEFKSKANDVMLYAKAAELRFQWYLSKGMTEEQVVGLVNKNAAKSLDDIVDAMRKKNE